MNFSYIRWRGSAVVATIFGAFLSLGSVAQAQLQILDDFEVDEGHFALQPSFSGTSQGFIKAGPTNGTADRVTTDFFDGLASQLIVLDDDPTVPGSPAPNSVDSWRLRHLSGSGTIANNINLAMVPGGMGYVGYWLKTSSFGMQASIGIDDGAALEIARWQPINADGQWHFYEWQLQDANDWDPFAGTGPNGAIDGATTITLDNLFFRGGVGFPTGADFDVQFLVDRVSYNPTGSIVPEPAGAAMLALGVAALAGRRRRAV